MKPLGKRMRLITVTKKLAVMEMSVSFGASGCIGCTRVYYDSSS